MCGVGSGGVGGGGTLCEMATGATRVPEEETLEVWRQAGGTLCEMGTTLCEMATAGRCECFGG